MPPHGRVLWYDYWSVITSGDIAYFILGDLFADSDWRRPGRESLHDACDSYAEECWQTPLRKHGR
jgi:hypothetical protein